MYAMTQQRYRRILRTFEEFKFPERVLLFEMLDKCESKEDWDNFVVIAKVYQSKYVVLTGYSIYCFVC